MLSTIVGGIIAGTIAGLFVALSTAAAARFSRPRFVLRKIGDSDYAVLTNQGWRGVAIGNSNFLGQGGDLRLAENPEERVTRSYLRTNRCVTVRLGGKLPGSTVTFTYLPMWWRSRRDKREYQIRKDADVRPPYNPNAHGLSKWKEYSVPVTF
jgi:hypothetical protein